MGTTTALGAGSALGSGDGGGGATLAKVGGVRIDGGSSDNGSDSAAGSGNLECTADS